jgi:hypothetical protein
MSAMNVPSAVATMQTPQQQQSAPVPDPTNTISALNRSHILLDSLPSIHKSHCYSLAGSPHEAALAAVGLSHLSASSAAAPAVPAAPHPILSAPRFQASTLVAYLESLIERGDVQTCVCIASLLREFHPSVLQAMEALEKEREALITIQQQQQQQSHPPHGSPSVAFPPSRSPTSTGAAVHPSLCVGHSLVTRMKQWWWSYIELLQRRELHSCASELIQLAGVAGPGSEPELAKINQKSTTITLLCPVCKHQSTQTGVGCTSKQCTRTRMTNCAVCHLTVQGVYVWCQSCGHGGHMEHMQGWFQQHAVCPTGCLHRCVEMLSMQLPQSARA